MSTQVENRRERERLETRSRILDAASELLLKAGVDGFSMRKLAERIGYTPTAIYFHFPDKESLLGEVIEGRFMLFRKAFERIGREPDPIKRLAKMGRAFVEFALEHPDHYRLMFLTSSFSNIPKGRLIERGNPAQDCYAFLKVTVAEGLEQGRFRPEFKDPDQVAQIYFGGVHGVMALHIIKGEDDWIDHTPIKPKAKRMVEALIRGMTRDAEDLSDLGGDEAEAKLASSKQPASKSPAKNKVKVAAAPKKEPLR